MSKGRLEAQITIPVGGWSVSVAITAVVGSPFTVTVAAGTYYPTDLLSTFQTQLNAASGADGVFTVSGSFGESGTGLVTIAHTVETFTITWSSTDLRDALGFTGTLTPAALTFTGTRNAQGVWLPDCQLFAERGTNDPGYIQSDRTESVSPRGDVYALKFQHRTVLPMVRWVHVTKPRAKVVSETTVGASFEQWWRYTHNAELSYFAVCPPVRLIWDADTSATYHEFRLIGRNTTEMPRVVEGWDGLWTVEIRGIKTP
jgi:hypothetical protein